MTAAIYAGGGPLDGTIRAVEIPPPPFWRAALPPPPIPVAPLRPDDDAEITRREVTYRLVRHLPRVAAVYWYEPASGPSVDEIRAALDAVLGR